MYQKIVWMALAIGVLSCSTDKSARLVELKKKSMQLSAEISQLEQELAAEGKTKIDLGMLVGVKAVETKVFRHFIEVQGKVDGEGNVAVFAESMGIIEQIFVKPGSRVSKGQVMAQLNDPALRDQLAALQTNYELAADLFQKQKSLWEVNIGSEVQYLQAKANKESMEAQIAAMKSQIEMMRIKSPIDGTVEDAPYKVGQMASPQVPSFRVVSFNALRIKANLSESYASRVHEGDVVQIRIPDLQQDVEAKITFVSKYIDPVNRTFQVEAAIDRKFDFLKVNMVVVLKINDYMREQAVVLPVNVIQTDYQGSAYVFKAVEVDGVRQAQKTVVQTGTIYNGNAEITTGLQAGDKVVFTGYQDLENGKRIQF